MGAATESAQPSLPKLAGHGRRGMLLGLIGLGMAAGLCSVAIGWLVGRLASGLATGLLWVLLALIGCFFATKYAERVLAEKLGQHYVAQLRVGLMTHALLSERAPSVGITAARSSNDLSSIRNWVTQGLVPLLAAAPLLLTCGLGLWLLNPLLAGALVLSMMVEAAALAALAAGTFRTARSLRRQRGALAGHLADTVLAAGSIRAGGGVGREVRRIEQKSETMIQAAIARARYAAALRACALAVPLLGTVLVIAAAAHQQLPAPQIATALTLMGICTAALGEWGKAVEYRQNFKAGARILAPLLQQSRIWSEEQATASASGSQEAAAGAHGVQVEQLSGASGLWPQACWTAGSRVELVGPEREVADLAAQLATGCAGAGGAGRLRIDGVPASALPETERRAKIGAVLEAMAVERGPVLRALRYRHPSTSQRTAAKLAAQCGLDLESLPQGGRTQLRRGGEPLDFGQRAALLTARALLGTPALLVVDRAAAKLPAGRYERLLRRLRDYPGVICFPRGALPGLEPTASWEFNAQLEAEPTLR